MGKDLRASSKQAALLQEGRQGRTRPRERLKKCRKINSEQHTPGSGSAGKKWYMESTKDTYVGRGGEDGPYGAVVGVRVGEDGRWGLKVELGRS